MVETSCLHDSMATSSNDKKHLGPLLEFLRFVSERGKKESARFPKRINGVIDLKREDSSAGFDTDSLSSPRGLICEVADSSSNGRSPSAAQESPVTQSCVPEDRKRSRSPHDDQERIVGCIEPTGCEIESTATGKGCVTSKYVDLSLADLGLEPIMDPSSTHLTKEIARQIQGCSCCYLLPGTSMVVKGDIVDVSFTSETVLISPERGVRVDLEWISIRRVFRVPKNIGEVREEAVRRIQQIIKAERRGGGAPEISLVPKVDREE